MKGDVLMEKMKKFILDVVTSVAAKVIVLWIIDMIKHI